MASNVGNRFMQAILSSPLYPLLGNSFGLITVTGRKTGALYSTPVNVVQDGECIAVVSLKSRSWWRNLRGGRSATLRVSGREYAVRAQVLESQADVAAALGEHLKRHPAYARYLNVHLGLDGRPVRADLDRAAAERVMIHLQPADAK